MTHPTIFITFIFALFSSYSTADEEGLQLKSSSKDEVRGCYKHNQTLAVCFDVKKGSIKIQKSSGEGIVYYQELGPEMFLYQVLDKAFITGRGASMIYVPDDVPRTPEALRAFSNDIQVDDEYESPESVYQAAIRELHRMLELRLLERVSSALADNTTRLKILEPFHGLCLNLLKAADVEIPDELRAEPDQNDRDKRCSRPTANKCRGMCGPGCFCWKWYCGDCCWHRGCYEHDLCCKKSRFSKYCLTPPGCTSFSGYPKCLRSSGWK